MATAEVVQPEVKPSGNDLRDKAVNIGGKPYVMVNERIIKFNELFPNGSIIPELITIPTSEEVWMKVTVCPDNSLPPENRRYFVGHSQATWGDGFINKTAALENCETSAVGRALAMLGIGVLSSIASAEEVMKAKTQPARNAQSSEEYEASFDDPNARLPQVRWRAIEGACDTHGVPKLAQEQYLKDYGYTQWSDLHNHEFQAAIKWAAGYQKQPQSVEKAAKDTVAILEARKTPVGPTNGPCVACGSKMYASKFKEGEFYCSNRECSTRQKKQRVSRMRAPEPETEDDNVPF